MRSFVVMAMFVASLAHAAWGEYKEVRTLTIDSDELALLAIDAGAGSMDVTGVAGLDKIVLRATIVVEDGDEDEARKFIEKRMTLSLQQENGVAILKSHFDNGRMRFSSNARIDLDISVPQGIAVKIKDGAGSIDVSRTMADISIDDGSGSIDVDEAASVDIDDGSGSLDVSNASGDVFIVDGSGSISVKHVAGSVTIDDGSGSIRVSDIENNLTIVDDGSGGLSISDVRGDVREES